MNNAMGWKSLGACIALVLLLAALLVLLVVAVHAAERILLYLPLVQDIFGTPYPTHAPTQDPFGTPTPHYPTPVTPVAQP